ncbi:MAG: hypothetical protein JJT82_00735 [Legionellaceae bacterium]|nr:hypothetical protein [Legionellaceae bacterium]
MWLQERVRQFRKRDFKLNQKLYESLVEGQDPEILFITCADSRIVPHQLVQAKPGEVFTLRNAGNIIPPYPDNGGECATIEYALTALNIKHIIICGHSQCGAMQGLLDPTLTREMPILNAWLKHAPAKACIEQQFNPEKDHSLWDKAIAENVRTQLEHLKQYPCVQAKLARNDLTLHAWIYVFEKGTVFSLDHQSRHFHPLLSEDSRSTPVKNRLNGTFVLTVLAVLAVGCGGGFALLSLVLMQLSYCVAASTLMLAGAGYLSFQHGFFAGKAAEANPAVDSEYSYSVPSFE